MSIVNFAVPTMLNNKINFVVKQKGFQSKAEFFRVAAIHYIEQFEKHFVASEETRFDYLTTELEKELLAKYSGKILPPLEQQLAEL